MEQCILPTSQKPGFKRKTDVSLPADLKKRTDILEAPADKLYLYRDDSKEYVALSQGDIDILHKYNTLQLDLLKKYYGKT